MSKLIQILMWYVTSTIATISYKFTRVSWITCTNSAAQKACIFLLDKTG